MSNIILIGYMGCGKSTIGKKLSYAVRKPYVDTDKLIETKEKKTISTIFSEQGEEAFREMETACIKSLFAQKQEHVIAVGGGLPLRSQNRALLKKLGTVIYLRAKPETIYERLKTDTTRPLLQCADPKEKISRMLLQRAPVYEEAASYVVDVDDKSFEQIIKEIKEKTDETISH